MGESVCHLQDSSFQVSLVRESALPVWVGMGWLGGQTPVDQTPSAEPKLRLILSLYKAPSHSTPTSEKVRSRARLSLHHMVALIVLFVLAVRLFGFFMASRSDVCHHHLTLMY